VIESAPRFPRFERSPRDDGRRDSEAKVTWLGIVVPALLTAWAILNALTGQAAFLLHTRRGIRGFTLVWVDHAAGVAAIVLFKLAVAVALFGWFFMANRDNWMKWSQIVTLVAAALAGLFLILATLLATGQ
jgi:hypothetical protein